MEEKLLKVVKQFLKIEEDFCEDDDEIRLLILVAEEYLKNAGCKTDRSNNLFVLAIKMLVGHWYENREILGKADKLAYSLENIITQLIYSYEGDTNECR
ncbi:head-tail connector protein [Romboutsia lituseburensis]|uniref:head-tail connector protein n=1 Tax=Romboutsia lituseburensis TaxID=1537 RepID=UPI0022EB4D9D|nr:head-tail connector protein [Romboutsia lituseburensis]